jgi:hypothetical protein
MYVLAFREAQIAKAAVVYLNTPAYSSWKICIKFRAVFLNLFLCSFYLKTYLNFTCRPISWVRRKMYVHAQHFGYSSVTVRPEEISSTLFQDRFYLMASKFNLHRHILYTYVCSIPPRGSLAWRGEGIKLFWSPGELCYRKHRFLAHVRQIEG